MRPAVYFPELKLGDTTVPAHTAIAASAHTVERVEASLVREVVRAVSVHPLGRTRGRSHEQYSVLEA